MHSLTLNTYPPPSQCCQQEGNILMLTGRTLFLTLTSDSVRLSWYILFRDLRLSCTEFSFAFSQTWRGNPNRHLVTNVLLAHFGCQSSRDGYNPLLLMLWKANINVQFVAESSLALAHYVSGYVTKAERSNMQEIWQEVRENRSVYSRLWSFGIRSLRFRECGLYEASDLLLGDHLTESLTLSSG